MISTQTTVQLSVEEMALARSLAGSPDAGKLLLYSAYGELTEQDESSRLYAAGHSMVARDLVYIVDGNAELSEEMKRLLSVLIDNDFSLQFIKEEGGLASLIYAIQGENIVEQESKQGVAYRLTDRLDKEQITAGGLRFFEIGAARSAAYPEALLPITTLDELRGASDQSVEEILAMMKATDLPDALRQPLTQDLHETMFHGAVLRLEREEGEIRSDRGILTLGGKDRVWLFPITEKDGEPYVRVVAGSTSTFSRELEQLMQS